VDMTDLADISEIRKQLEPVAASRAARTASADMRERLAALAEEIPTFDDGEGSRELLRKDMHVHRAIYRAANNPHLEDILVSLDSHATRIWCLFLDRLPGVGEHVREHVSLLKAIVDGDEETAAALTLEHIEGFEQAIREIL
jgi:DNA-binding GntR family transcriptional regulator